MTTVIADRCGFRGPAPEGASGDHAALRRVYEAVTLYPSGNPRFPDLEDVAALMLLCFISPAGKRVASRHVLLEGAPGTAKSELTKVVARVLHAHGAGGGVNCEGGRSETAKSELTEVLAGALYAHGAGGGTDRGRGRSEYERVQGTPDLMPSSFIGYEGRVDAGGGFAFLDGPLLRDPPVFHVDEINRISPRTLAVLFEVMAESQVTLPSLLVEEAERKRPVHSMVVGTQNPDAFVGTNPLPEPLLDRFLIRVSMPFPKRNLLKDLLLSKGEGGTGGERHPVDFDGIRKQTAALVRGDRGEAIAGCIAELLYASWPLEGAAVLPGLDRRLPATKSVRGLVDGTLAYGLGVRAGQSLRDLASALAWCRGGGNNEAEVLREDVELVTPYVVGHRLQFRPDAAPSVKERSEFAERLFRVGFP